MIRIAIAEDEREFREQCESYVRRYCEEQDVQAEVCAFEDGMDLLEAEERDGKPWNILFLDVQMRHLDGFRTAQKIREKDEEAVIIFITTLAQYAVRGYEVDAMDYLIKPVTYDQFCLRMMKALHRTARSEEHYLLLPTEEGKEKVAVSRIRYVDVDRHTLRIHTGERVYEMRQTIGKMEETLRPYHFSRCDQSALVNLRAVTRVGRDTVDIDDGAGRTVTLPVSRSRKKPFLQELGAYLG